MDRVLGIVGAGKLGTTLGLAASDAGCLAAWAESRDRFLGRPGHGRYLPRDLASPLV